MAGKKKDGKRAEKELKKSRKKRRVIRKKHKKGTGNGKL